MKANMHAHIHTHTNIYILAQKKQGLTETVGHKDVTHVGGNEVIKGASEQANLQQMLEDSALGQAVHVGPRHSWLHGRFNALHCVPLHHTHERHSEESKTKT